MFLPNVPGATFIPRATSIPESRVSNCLDVTIFLIFFCPQKIEKIGCHSNFNPECNAERGYIDSLSIPLGLGVSQSVNMIELKSKHIYKCLCKTHLCELWLG